jgi:competence protein ComGC
MTKKLSITFIAAACVVVFLIWAVPTLKHARDISAENTCIGHLQMIQAAKEHWAVDHHKVAKDVPTWADLVGKDRYLPEMLVCPDGGTYTIGSIDQNPKCTIPGHVLP